MSHDHAYGVHRNISRDEWQRIHDNAAGEYRTGESFREGIMGIGKMRRKLFSQATGSVLDVACGYGSNFPYLTNAAHLTATDFSTVMLKMAEQQARKLGVTVDLREAD